MLAFSENRFRDLLEHGVSRMMANAQKKRLICKVNPYAAWIPVIGALCNGLNAPPLPDEISYNVSVRPVPCEALENEKPEQVGSGRGRRVVGS